MKKTILISIIILITSCMNKQERAKKNCPPGEFFDGKDLKMAEAIYDGNTSEIEYLIRSLKFDVNARGYKLRDKYRTHASRYTYLGYAVLVGELQSAEKLLQLGADVNGVSIQDNLAIMPNIVIASSIKNKKMIKLLMGYNVNLNPPISESPIHGILIGNAEKSIIDDFLDDGADINYKDYISGDMPIITALRINKFDYVNYFLDHGAKPLELDYVGNSFAYLVQKEIEEGRISGQKLKEYQKLKERLVDEFEVKFPLKNEQKKGMEESIQRYENLSKEDKILLGETEKNRIDLFKECVKKGVNVMGKPFE